MQLGAIKIAGESSFSLEGIGIYTTYLHSKNNALQQCQAPSPAGEGWGEDNKIN